ncbi:hypothetical protein A3B93_02170 [Candidatus Nomurabacteria bacterium RIFCSPHIGHO2_02_FULL_42_24]|uniref:Pseudouridine synthase RsuA/RluA-like domain-containing protein n=1 Tax=Candidatus Nomurabacteria bacterium RIFCSPHIGHO2_02_FULL_42_24 TaxID=1801757 RepID=A0A1F6WIE9_9BACT|nr:MAG: Pseudouridine synthase, RluA family [Parcubacteria group bacterium GW2011_GWA2_42_18]OGI81642.1 MAG: hypothetical protein A3B93_02170 [Candidatus Nomurabacteria bacterium RIFCSPHIGHO2_02_FULL_42_24]
MTPKIEILYEDEEVLVVNKPAGLLVHSTEKSKEKTLVDFLLKKYPEIKKVGEDSSRPGIVHRLDKDTSGVLVVAKNQRAFDFLKKQFQDHSVKKKYLALVWGELKRERGIINTPIGRSKNDSRKRRAGIGAASKLREALTEYKVLKRFTTPPQGASLPDKEGMGGGNFFTLLEIYPRTGRTHQIRVHLSSIGHPVVGDNLYATHRSIPAGIKRLALHAVSIKFRNPSGKEIKVEAPIPSDLKKAFGIA